MAKQGSSTNPRAIWPICLQAAAAAPKRAAIIAYFFLLDLTGLAFLGHQGLVSFDIFQMAILSLPVLLIGMYLGQRHFLGASPEGFRRVTLILLITLSALGIIRAFMG